MKMVDDARDWWKWSSTHVVGAVSVLPMAWEILPHEFKAYVSDGYMPYIGGVMFFGAFLAARVRAQ